MYKVTEIMVDNADVGQMTSPNRLEWSTMKWCSGGKSWLLERDRPTTRRQPLLWRKALNDDDVQTIVVSHSLCLLQIVTKYTLHWI